MIRTGLSNSRQDSPALIHVMWLTVLVVLLVTGCSEPAPTAATEDSVALSTAQRLGKTSIPIRLKGEGAFVGQDLAPGFGPPTFGKSTFEGRCSEPSDFVIRFAVWGQALHLGQVTADLEHCSLVNFQDGASTIRDGIIVITSSNGDELHANYTRGEGQAVESVEFVGGTGRFSNARGLGHQVATVDRATQTVPSFELQGTITYDASDRRN